MPVTPTIDDATILTSDTLAAGGTAIAEVFGLGDSTEASGDWPVDDGDSVLAADINGAISGRLLLAVNDEVAGRLTSDPSRLRDGFTRTLRAMAEAAGVDPADVEVGEIGTTDDRPSSSVEIYDGKQMCALFGALLNAPAGVTAGAPVGGPVGAEGAPGTTPGPAVYEPAPFAANGAALASPSAGPLSLLQDVEMTVTVELGRTTLPIRELLALQPGMVVEIDRQAGAPIDVLVNGRLIACGEVVVIDEEFGIRITEIVDPKAGL
jgi:flagellar motor switch protein FliN